MDGEDAVKIFQYILVCLIFLKVFELI
jgi:hypothetical protein